MLMIFFNKNVNSSISKFITARGEDICLAMLIHAKKKNEKSKYYEKLFENQCQHHALSYNEIQVNLILAFWMKFF